MSAKQLIASILVTGAALAAAPQVASACSSAGCLEGKISPREGTVPANLPGFLWHPATFVSEDSLQPTPKAEHIELIEHDGDVEVAVPVTIQKVDYGQFPAWEIVPEQALTPGASHELRTEPYCGQTEGLTVSFDTGPEASLPNSLGTLVADSGATGTVAVSSSSCTSDAAVYKVPVRVELSAAAEPWKDALIYETLVDGEPWRPKHGAIEAYPPGESWEGRGVDLLYSTCDDEWPVLEPGEHTVQMTATLPGTELELSTNEVTVDIDCGWASGGDGGGPSADAGGSDAGESDVGGADAGPVQSDTGGRDNSQSDSGGGCNLGGGNLPAHLPALAAFAVGWFCVRRRSS